MNKIFFFSIVLIGISICPDSFVNAQGVGINSSNNPPNPSAILDVSSTTKGTLITRMTTAQRDAIVNPVQGLQIYNTTTNCLNYYTGITWLALCGTCPAPPVPTASSNSPLCVGSTLTLSASTVPGVTYNWTGPNGFSSTLQNPVINNVSLSADGTYSVTATSNACTSNPGTTTVTVNNNPASTFTYSPTTAAMNHPVTLSPTLAGATSYSWTFQNGAPSTSTAQNASVTWSTAGTYSVSLTVTNNGCSSTTNSLITIGSIYVGTGADGAVTISVNKNLNTDNIAGGRTCADAVNYSVTGLTANSVTLSSAPNTGCLAIGDEILLINLQGTASNYVNVGNYETLIVQSVVGNVVTFTTNKTKFYGDGAGDDNNIGTASNNQRVMLQRVPNYTNVTINNSVTLTANSWDGAIGGILFFRASGTVNVAGVISMLGKGYRGGPLINANLAPGYATQGESYGGTGVQAQANNKGGGGGGIIFYNNCTGSGGGGGHATGGGVGTTEGNSNCLGNVGGTTYGLSTLTSAFLGSGGGGGGGGGQNPTNGAAGGGMIVLAGNTVTVSGNILTTGGAAVTGTPSGGGGGAGGSILMQFASVTLGSNLVTATGGTGSLGVTTGGLGGNGYIAVYYSSSLSGSTNPAAYTQQVP